MREQVAWPYQRRCNTSVRHSTWNPHVRHTRRPNGRVHNECASCGDLTQFCGAVNYYGSPICEECLAALPPGVQEVYIDMANNP